jgi:hypothetical protein
MKYYYPGILILLLAIFTVEINCSPEEIHLLPAPLAYGKQSDYSEDKDLLGEPQIKDDDYDYDPARGLKGSKDALMNLSKSAKKCVFEGATGIKGECKKYSECRKYDDSKTIIT